MNVLVRQRHDWDCAVACVAMALRLDYDLVLPFFQRARRQDMKGFYGMDIVSILMCKELGVPSHLEEMYYGGKLCRHIVQVSLRENRMAHHWVWVDEAGHLHCPAETVKCWTVIRGFGQFVHVTDPNEMPLNDVPF